MGVRDVYTLQSLRGAKEKCAFIQGKADDDWLNAFLYYALNPLISYHLSEKTVRVSDKSRVIKTKLTMFTDIFECCEFCAGLRAMDDATARQVKVFLYHYCSEEEREIYIRLLAKTLRLGITAKTVNKVIPNLIPEWEIQQAYPIDKYPIADGTEFWLTQKLNGVRATYYNGKLIARSGIAYSGLEHIILDLYWVNQNGYVLDGELTLLDKGDLSDNEAFRVATGIINSDDADKSMICFTVFDMIPIQDFESKEPRVDYATRRRMLNQFGSQLNQCSAVKVLPVLYHGKDLSKVDELLEQMVQEDKEGLMLNTNVPYFKKRHQGILKVKRFYTMDLPIIRCEEGSGRLEGTLGSFVLDYKGNEVSVGSGFSDEQRELFWNMQSEMCSKLCEVKYKEISHDKKTKLESLQFPVFIGVREDKSEVSYA